MFCKVVMVIRKAWTTVLWLPTVCKVLHKHSEGVVWSQLWALLLLEQTHSTLGPVEFNFLIFFGTIKMLKMQKHSGNHPPNKNFISLEFLPSFPQQLWAQCPCWKEATPQWFCATSTFYPHCNIAYTHNVLII